MTIQELSAASSCGGKQDISPTCLLLHSARVCYESTLNTDPASIVRAQSIVDEILAAATVGGFTQADILATLLARGGVTPRLMQMAEAATAAAGLPALEIIAAKFSLA